MSVPEAVFVCRCVQQVCVSACRHPIVRLIKGTKGSYCDFKSIFSSGCLVGQGKLPLMVEWGACQVANKDEEDSVQM